MSNGLDYKYAWCRKCGKRSSHRWIELFSTGATCPHCGNKGTWKDGFRDNKGDSNG